MRRLLVVLAVSAAASAQQSKPFTLQQVLSPPYALSLTAAPVGDRFAWVENAEGVRNIWVGAPKEPARQLTHYTEDDGQDIAGLAWSPDAKLIAYTYGAESGHSGKPANPAHLQRETDLKVIVKPVDSTESALSFANARAPLFTPDGNWLLFLRFGKIYIACLQNCPFEDVPSVLGKPLVIDRGNAHSLTLSRDGKLLAFVSSRGGHAFIGLYNFAVGTLSFVAPSTGIDSAPSFSPDGKQLAWIREPFTDASEFAANRVSANPWSIQIADVATLATRTLFQPEANKPGSVIPRFATGNPRVWWTADGKVLFCSEADGWVHLYSIDAKSEGAKATALTPGQFEVEDVSVSQDGHTLHYASNDPVLKKLDADRRHLWQIDLTAPAGTPKQLTSGVGIETRPMLSADGATLAAVVSDSYLPMHTAFVARDGALASMHSVVAATYPLMRLVVPQQVLFSSSDKLFQLHGQVFLPAGKKSVARSIRLPDQRRQRWSRANILRSSSSTEVPSARCCLATPRWTTTRMRMR